MIPSFNAAGKHTNRRFATPHSYLTRGCFPKAPYSTSGTDTVSGLSSPGFMTTYGK